MQLSDLYKSPKSPWSKLRHHSLQLPHPHADQQQRQQPARNSIHNPTPGQAQSAQAQQGEPPPSTPEQDYGDPDLVSRDKTKQKEAVRRYLAENIRYDWAFAWPEQEAEAARAAYKAAKAAELVKQRPLDPASTFASPMPAPLAQVVAAAVAADKEKKKQREGTAEGSTAVDDSGAEPDSEIESVYSTVSEDQEHFRVRAEWTSDVSDDESVLSPITTGSTMVSGVVGALPSPFRFDSPDTVGVTIQASAQTRKAKVRRDQRAEMTWNQGLACFVARRDAWTGAHTVRVKRSIVAPPAPASPASPRRSLFRIRSNTKADPAPAVAIPTVVEAPPPHANDDPSTSTTTPTASAPASAAAPSAAAAPLSPVTSNSRHSQHSQRSQHSQLSAGHDTMGTTPATSDVGGENSLRRSTSSQAAAVCSIPPPPPLPPVHTELSVETLIPLASPLLPPANPMRASITPAIYLNLYDKVVLHSLQPSCPINLSDMMRSCVAGWKRDGEWPPRAVEITPAAAMAVARKKRRADRRAEARKDRRDSSAPGFGRRMSNLLSRQPSHPTATAATATGGTAQGAAQAASGASAAGGTGGSAAEASDGIGGSQGIRRSLQRVLGLGHTHGHAQSAGSAGAVSAVGGEAKE